MRWRTGEIVPIPHRCFLAVNTGRQQELGLAQQLTPPGESTVNVWPPDVSCGFAKASGLTGRPLTRLRINKARSTVVLTTREKKASGFQLPYHHWWLSPRSVFILIALNHTIFMG